ncbi:MAG: hypothetical protein C5B55_14700 [Blastocatellia bacterium]|nr:MAG: hypothetical protein C5B55_14700 [Blastocatellia bacterium]
MKKLKRLILVISAFLLAVASSQYHAIAGGPPLAANLRVNTAGATRYREVLTTSADEFNAFWEKFKAAVIKSDKDAVASLSKFPIGMSYGIRSIKTKPELLRRFKEVFSKQTDAVKCFQAKEPEKDSANPRKYSIACPDAAGNEVVIYEFERGSAGWKFVRLDNINE